VKVIRFDINSLNSGVVPAVRSSEVSRALKIYPCNTLEITSWTYPCDGWFVELVCCFIDTMIVTMGIREAGNAAFSSVQKDKNSHNKLTMKEGGVYRMKNFKEWSNTHIPKSHLYEGLRKFSFFIIAYSLKLA
jgi:hypothetical protein